MGAAEVAELWERMRASGAQPTRAPAATTAATACSPPCADAAPECGTLDALLASVACSDAALADAAVLKRRAELERLRELLQAAPPEVLEAAAADPLGKCLLPRFEDASERCRQLAVEALLLLLLRAPVAVLGLLPYAVPVLRERLVRPRPGAACPEPSEELRLLLVQLAHALLRAADGAALPYGAELVELLEAALGDEAPAVACAACAAAVQLCDAAGRRLGAAAATRLVEAATPLLTHRRAATRLAALDAVGALVRGGAHEHCMTLAAFAPQHEVPLAAFYGGEPARVNYLGKLATDGHAGVRTALVRTVADWLLLLPEAADHAPLLLPYVLSGLSDDAPAVAAAASEAMDALGAAYEAQHADALRDAARYGVDPLPGGCAADDGQAHPRLGARLLVRDQLGHVLPACVADLRAWTTELRPRAAALLETLLAHAQGAAIRYAPMLLPALCAAAADEDARLADAATRCCLLVARFFPPHAWLPPVLEHVRTAQQASAAVKLLAVMADASDASALTPHAAEIQAVMHADENAALTQALARLRAVE